MRGAIRGDEMRAESTEQSRAEQSKEQRTENRGQEIRGGVSGSDQEIIEIQKK